MLFTPTASGSTSASGYSARMSQDQILHVMTYVRTLMKK
jgi:hypothetical protein